MLQLQWLLLFFSLLLFPAVLHAQQVTGLVCDSAGRPLEHVAVMNIYTNAGLLTPANGRFQIEAKASELLEFHKLGYKTARVRISNGATPPMYKIVLHAGIELKGVEVRGGFKDYQHDSAYYEQYFRKQIYSTSKELARFRYEYKRLDQMKFVDYHFNEKLITSLTGLKGDSAQAYIQQYRPSYNTLRNMSDYDHLAYITSTVSRWRTEEHLKQNKKR
jgi:hypothetical protein